MKNPVALILAALLTAPAASAQQAADPSGVWLRAHGTARVEIAPCGGDICATTLWIGDTAGAEEPGDRLVMSLEQDSAGTLVGTADEEKRERTYSMTLRVGEDRLVTRGCVLGGLLCRDVTWTPAD